MAFAVREEMSVVHRSSTNECSVSVRGTVSVSRTDGEVEADGGGTATCDLSLGDPSGHVESAASKSYDIAEPMDNLAFRVSVPDEAVEVGPIVEYSCGESLRPVPMVRCFLFTCTCFIQTFHRGLLLSPP